MDPRPSIIVNAAATPKSTSRRRPVMAAALLLTAFVGLFALLVPRELISETEPDEGATGVSVTDADIPLDIDFYEGGDDRPLPPESAPKSLPDFPDLRDFRKKDPESESPVPPHQPKSPHGLSPAVEAAVARGLAWLARVQSPGGAWKLDGPFPDKGNANDVAGTALGLRPFLAAGKTHKVARDNPYDKPIERGLRFLIAIQDKRTGAFSRDMYAHGLATIAVCQAYGLNQDYELKKPGQAALNFIVSAQHASGGWRYAPGQAGDMSVSAWQILALKSGLMAGCDVPTVTLKKAQTFLDSVTDPKTDGAAYLEGQKPTPTMTAAALLCRQYLQGWGRQNLRLIKAVDNHILPNSPGTRSKDSYYLHFATQVMHNLGGDDSREWKRDVHDRLVKAQATDRNDAAVFGSWSPAGDPWGGAGGRLMATSLSLLILEVDRELLPITRSVYRPARTPEAPVDGIDDGPPVSVPPPKLAPRQMPLFQWGNG